MILARASRLVQLYWENKLHPYVEKVQLISAQAILCGEESPDDQTEDYHVAVVSSKANTLYYLSQFEQLYKLEASLQLAQIAEGLRLVQLAERRQA